MNYNKKRHLELLQTVKRPKELLNISQEERSERHDEIIMLEFEFEQDEKVQELYYYNYLLNNHLHWEYRTQYFELIQEMLDGQINFEKLKKKVDLIEKAITYLRDNLILLEPNKKSEGFTPALINNILAFDDDYRPRKGFSDEDKVYEEEFKKRIKDSFIKIKERYL